ncbi:hypothetical protein [Kitasatospora sp. NPDC057198]|uniref:hypothetical protein n=1 Tax=Kitasatospora sp. NPDC057198 TaxID=3346046 RepID=UPI003636CB97
MTTTPTDTEILSTPAPSQEAGAWLELVAQIGSDVGRMADGQDRRDRHGRTKLAGIKYTATSSAVVQPTGTAVFDLGAPAVGRQWSVRRLLLVDNTNPGGTITGGIPTAKTLSFAAGAAGLVGLDQGAVMTGFDIATAPVGAAVSGPVTVQSLATISSVLTYQLSCPVAGGLPLSVRFPQGIPAYDSTSFPQVSVPAIAGGPAYSVTLFGYSRATGSTPGTGWWYIGAPAAYAPQNAAVRIPSLPHTEDFGGEQVCVIPRDRLFAVVTGATPGRTLVARADVLDSEQGTATAIESI